MAIKIRFDTAGNPMEPTFVLASQIGYKYGILDNLSDISIGGNLTETDTISFTVDKRNNTAEAQLWDKIKDFKLVWCREWDQWFQVHVTYTDERHIFKNVELQGLGESELSQLYLNGYEINTELDIERDDYKPTVVYNPEDPNHSLVDRLLKAAPHYSVRHVDASIAGIQRSFSFDKTDIPSAFSQIAEEIDCLVVYNNDSNPETMLPARQISLYDLEEYCLDCHNRFDVSEGTGVCPECGGSNIKHGYGVDTTLCFSSEDLAESITVDGDEDSMKNCFTFSGGDDLFTATVRNCLPDGSGYYWYITEEQKEDMPAELAALVNQYQADYQMYNYQYQVELDQSLLDNFESLADKYSVKHPIETDFGNIVGFHALNQGIYEVLDFTHFLENTMFPDGGDVLSTASAEAAKITNYTMNPIAVPDASYISSATAGNAALALAKSMISPNFQIKVTTGSLSGDQWTGSFTITSYYDPEDTATTETITATLSDDYNAYLTQRIDKILAANPIEDTSIVTLFSKSNADFAEALKDYNLVSLQYLTDACQSCMDILIESNVSNPDLWINTVDDLYTRLYVPYNEKYSLITAEVQTRQAEVELAKQMSDALNAVKKEIQDALNLKNYLGSYWPMMYVYRREESYENSNYISDGMDTPELFKHALDFLDIAIGEVHKASIIKQTVTTDLKNLLVIKEFQSLADNFEVGNFVRVKVDGDVKKMRLLSYQIDFSDLSNISVTFSNVVQRYDSTKELRDKLNSAASMSSSYGAVTRQAENGSDAYERVSGWFRDGLAMTQMKLLNDADNQNMVYDEHGILMRQKDELLDEYNPIQMKWINSTLAITPDNWETTSAVFGKFYYRDPATGEYKVGYGVNGEKVIGDLIMGNNMRIIDSNGNDIFTIMDNRVAIRVDALDGRMTSLEQDADSINIRVQNLENSPNEVDHVTTTTGYTFGADGLNIHKDGEEMENLLDNTGMYVKRSGENVLVANNEGVEAINLKSRQFLIVGKNSRFEDFDNGTDHNRTACFYIGS